MGSKACGQQAMSRWRQSMGDAELDAYITASPEYGVDFLKDMIRIKWNTGSESFKGRSRYAATAKACCMVISMISQSRKSASAKGPPQIRKWMQRLVDQNNGTVELTQLFEEDKMHWHAPRSLPESLTSISDVPMAKLSRVPMQ